MTVRALARPSGPRGPWTASTSTLRAGGGPRSDRPERLRQVNASSRSWPDFHQPDPGTRRSALAGASRSICVHDRGLAHAGFRFVHQDLGPRRDAQRGREPDAGTRRSRPPRAAASAGAPSAGTPSSACVRSATSSTYCRPVAELGAAERTGIAIVRALWDWEAARVLVVDEPTASLAARGSRDAVRGPAPRPREGPRRHLRVAPPRRDLRDRATGSPSSATAGASAPGTSPTSTRTGSSR